MSNLTPRADELDAARNCVIFNVYEETDSLFPYRRVFQMFLRTWAENNIPNRGKFPIFRKNEVYFATKEDAMMAYLAFR